jgi:ribosomal protein L11 methyltransferase
MPARVLDVGSGSGILALAALLLGAGQADCLDTDPVAVDATLANAAANGFADRVTARAGSLPAGGEPYRLVLANLVASVLLDLAGRLVTHTARGGQLVASGIIAARATEVEGGLLTAGFAVEERLDDGEWVSLRLVRS